MRLINCLSIAFLAAALAWTSAYACSFRKQSTEAIIDQSEIVFVARIQEVAEVLAGDRTKGADHFKNSPVRAKFRGVDTLKGDPSKIQFLRSGYGWGDCGVPFVIGRRYLVFTSTGGQVFLPSGSTDITPEYEPHGKFIKAIKQYITDGTKIPVTSNPFAQPTGKKQPAADKER